MFKRAVCVLAVLLSATAVYAAGAHKLNIIPLPCCGDPFEGPEADGVAILHYRAVQNETTIQIMFTGFKPNNVYDFELFSPYPETAPRGSNCDLFTDGAIVTDDKGSAHFKGTIHGVDWSDSEILFFQDPSGCTFTDDNTRAAALDQPNIEP